MGKLNRTKDLISSPSFFFINWIYKYVYIDLLIWSTSSHLATKLNKRHRRCTPTNFEQKKNVYIFLGSSNSSAIFRIKFVLHFIKEKWVFISFSFGFSLLLSFIVNYHRHHFQTNSFSFVKFWFFFPFSAKKRKAISSGKWIKISLQSFCGVEETHLVCGINSL